MHSIDIPINNCRFYIGTADLTLTHLITILQRASSYCSITYVICICYMLIFYIKNCSLFITRDGIKFYYVDKEGSESDAEAAKDTQSQPGDDHSHVHFSLDTSYKVKCEVNKNFHSLNLPLCSIISRLKPIKRFR